MVYVSQKQLGDVLTVSDAADSDVIGTASDIAEARAIIFHQTTTGVSVTLAEPSPADAKLITIANRGFVALTVNGTVMVPGPAYGMFWDGTEFQPVAVDGVGTVDHVSDSDTVEMLGDGTALNPLHANIKLSATAGNALQAANDGLLFPYKDISTSSLWVDITSGSDTTGNGSFRAPYKTINKAIVALVALGSPAGRTVFIYPGTYAEGVQFSHVSGTSFIGVGVRDDAAVIITGSHVLNERFGNKIKLRDLVLKASAAGNSALTLDSYNGPTTLENVSLRHADAETDPTAPVLDIQGGNANQLILYNCDIEGPIKFVDDSAQSQLELIIDGGAGVPDITFTSGGSTLTIVNRAKIGTVTHTAGILQAKSVGYFKKDTNGNSLISSAGSTSAVYLQDVGFLQPDGTFGQIVKTGVAPWAFDIHGDPANDTFTGPQTLMNSAKFMHADFTSPVNYTPLDASVVGHLKGIDEKLGDTAGGLSSVTSSDGQSIDFSGAGTAISPLTGEVKISQAANNAAVRNVDGIFVAAVEAGGLDAVSHQNSATISMTGSGTEGDPLIADTFISTAAHNMLKEDDGGLLVPEQVRTLNLGFTINYAWLANEILFAYTATEEFTLPVAFAGSAGRVGASTDLNTTVDFYLDTDPAIDNTTSFGFLTINSDADQINIVHFQFVGSSPVDVAVGNTIRAVARDAISFDYVTFTLLGTKPFEVA